MPESEPNQPEHELTTEEVLLRNDITNVFRERAGIMGVGNLGTEPDTPTAAVLVGRLYNDELTLPLLELTNMQSSSREFTLITVSTGLPHEREGKYVIVDTAATTFIGDEVSQMDDDDVAMIRRLIADAEWDAELSQAKAASLQLPPELWYREQSSE